MASDEDQAGGGGEGAARPPSPGGPGAAAHAAAEHVFRHESARLRASLARAVGSAHLDLVDDVVQDALVAALHHWRFAGVPENPGAWLTRVARRRAIDLIRRGSAERRATQALAAWLAREEEPPSPARELDDQLAMLLACACPELPETCRVPLMLHLAAGFTGAEIARAFLLSPEAASQRLVRGKRLLREHAVAIEVPEGAALEARLTPTLEAIYVMLAEGHSAHGESPIREDLLGECERLAGLLTGDARTATPTAHALMALVLFTRSRSPARLHEGGAILLMHEQDRSRWDRGRIERAMGHLARAAGGAMLTRFHLEAGIAAVHARSPSLEATDWREIIEFYDLLARVHPSPVVAVNRAAAVAMLRGAGAGLAELDAIASHPALAGYMMWWAARGELLARAGRRAEAVEAFERALACHPSDAERQLIEARLARARGSGV